MCFFLRHKEWPEKNHKQILPPTQSRDNPACVYVYVFLFPWTKLCDDTSADGRPCRKSWISLQQVCVCVCVCSCGPVIGRSVLAPGIKAQGSGMFAGNPEWNVYVVCGKLGLEPTTYSMLTQCEAQEAVLKTFGSGLMYMRESGSVCPFGVFFPVL